MACEHQTLFTMPRRPQAGEPLEPVALARCALVDAIGISCGFPPEHCERCADDETAPRSVESAINRDIIRRALQRRIEAGDRPRRSRMTLDDAVALARSRDGQAWVEDRLVAAVRRGLPVERATALAGGAAE